MQVTFDTLIQDADGGLVAASVEAEVSRWRDRGEWGVSDVMASVDELRVFALNGHEITDTLEPSDFEWLRDQALEVR